MATNSSTTTRRRSDAETTSNDQRTTEDTDNTASTDTDADTVGIAPAISYAGGGNTRGIELDPTTHGAHRRNNPTDI